MLWIALAVLAAVGAAAFLDDASAPIVRGDRAPAFALPDLASGQPRALADWEGRVVLLNFWATWCKPCEDEMPSMQRLADLFAGMPFELVAVSVDDDREEVVAFAERLGLRFPILLDPSEEVARRYQTTGYPESFLIGQDGRIASQRFVGPRAWDDPAYVALVARTLGVEAAAPLPLP